MRRLFLQTSIWQSWLAGSLYSENITICTLVSIKIWVRRRLFYPFQNRKVRSYCWKCLLGHGSFVSFGIVFNGLSMPGCSSSWGSMQQVKVQLKKPFRLLKKKIHQTFKGDDNVLICAFFLNVFKSD